MCLSPFLSSCTWEVKSSLHVNPFKDIIFVIDKIFNLGLFLHLVKKSICRQDISVSTIVVQTAFDWWKTYCFTQNSSSFSLVFVLLSYIHGQPRTVGMSIASLVVLTFTPYFPFCILGQSMYHHTMMFQVQLWPQHDLDF